MMDTRSKWERYAAAILVAAPLFGLALSCAAWLHYGIDLPFYDDFRVYGLRTALSLDPRDLFAPSNDTLYPVGMALDVLAQRFLNGNAVAYQFFSMLGLLGGLLCLQWRLLSSTFQDRLVVAAAFALGIFLTWPESYWGLQSMAYHHGLPILFLLGALTAIVDRSWAPRWGVPLVFLLGLLAGFSYISGAIAALAVAIVLIVARGIGLPHLPGLRAGGFSLLAAAAIAVPAQLWVILFAQQGHIHDPQLAWSLPTDAVFWMFMLGKFGRALALPYGRPVIGVIVTLVVIAITGSLAVYLARRVWRERAALPEDAARVAVIFFSLAAAVGVYLSLIAAGRAYIQASESKTLLALFIHGFPEHYHSVWATLLFPWIAAAAVLTARKWTAMPWIRTSPVVTLAAIAFVAIAAEAGAFAHAANFRSVQNFRLSQDVPCVRRALAEGVVSCSWYGPELFDYLRYARQIGASFVRYFPLPPIPLGTDDPPPLFRLGATPETLDVGKMSFVPTEEGLAFAAGIDPMLKISLPPGSLRSCWEVEVTIELKAEQDDFAELYALQAGQTRDFKTPPASYAPVPRGVFTTITLSAFDPKGLEDRLRIDPVGAPQAFILKNLEVRCRGNVPAQGG
jgi:hypothetical protein